MYIELSGSEQSKDVPAMVRYQFRHLGGSYFRANGKTIKQYRQFEGDYNIHEFNRFKSNKCKNNRQSASKEFQFAKVMKNIFLSV